MIFLFSFSLVDPYTLFFAMSVLVARELGDKFQFLLMLVDAVSYVDVGNYVYLWLLENVV